jgi:hypothetical protein
MPTTTTNAATAAAGDFSWWAFHFTKDGHKGATENLTYTTEATAKQILRIIADALSVGESIDLLHFDDAGSRWHQIDGRSL